MLAWDDRDWTWASPYRGFSDWQQLSLDIKPELQKSEVVIASAGVKSLYFLNRLDYDLCKTVMAENESGSEFGKDLRTGRSVISSASSLASIKSKKASGIIIIEFSHWRKKNLVSDESANWIEANTQQVKVLDPSLRLFVFTWGIE